MWEAAIAVIGLVAVAALVISVILLIRGGDSGSRGRRGRGGPTGPAGADGAGGAEGATGPGGATGADGAEGADGATGPGGATGAAGVIGPTGPASAGAFGPNIMGAFSAGTQVVTGGGPAETVLFDALFADTHESWTPPTFTIQAGDDGDYSIVFTFDITSVGVTVYTAEILVNGSPIASSSAPFTGRLVGTITSTLPGEPLFVGDVVSATLQSSTEPIQVGSQTSLSVIRVL